AGPGQPQSPAQRQTPQPSPDSAPSRPSSPQPSRQFLYIRMRSSTSASAAHSLPAAPIECENAAARIRLPSDCTSVPGRYHRVYRNAEPPPTALAEGLDWFHLAGILAEPPPPAR